MSPGVRISSKARAACGGSREPLKGCCAQFALRVRGEEGVEVGGQGVRLVDRDQSSAVVDPHQLCGLEVFG